MPATSCTRVVKRWYSALVGSRKRQATVATRATGMRTAAMVIYRPAWASSRVAREGTRHSLVWYSDGAVFGSRERRCDEAGSEEVRSDELTVKPATSCWSDSLWADISSAV